MKKLCLLIVSILMLLSLTACKSKYYKFDEKAFKIKSDEYEYIMYDNDYWIKDGNLTKITTLVQTALKDNEIKLKNPDRRASIIAVENDLLLFRYGYYNKGTNITKYVYGEFDLRLGSINLLYYYDQTNYFHYETYLYNHLFLIRDENSYFVKNVFTNEVLYEINKEQDTKYIHVKDNERRFAIYNDGKIDVYEQNNKSIILISPYKIDERVKYIYWITDQYYYAMLTGSRNNHLFDLMTGEDVTDEVTINSNKNKIVYQGINYEVFFKEGQYDKATKKTNSSIEFYNYENDDVIEISYDLIKESNSEELHELKDLAAKHLIELSVRNFYIYDNKLIVTIGDKGISYFINSRQTAEYAFYYDLESKELNYIGVLPSRDIKIIEITKKRG